MARNEFEKVECFHCEATIAYSFEVKCSLELLCEQCMRDFIEQVAEGKRNRALHESGDLI